MDGCEQGMDTPVGNSRSLGGTWLSYLRRPRPYGLLGLARKRLGQDRETPIWTWKYVTNITTLVFLTK